MDVYKKRCKQCKKIFQKTIQTDGQYRQLCFDCKRIDYHDRCIKCGDIKKCKCFGKLDICVSCCSRFPLKDSDLFNESRICLNCVCVKWEYFTNYNPISKKSFISVSHSPFCGKYDYYWKRSEGRDGEIVYTLFNKIVENYEYYSIHFIKPLIPKCDIKENQLIITQRESNTILLYISKKKGITFDITDIIARFSNNNELFIIKKENSYLPSECDKNFTWSKSSLIKGKYYYFK